MRETESFCSVHIMAQTVFCEPVYSHYERSGNPAMRKKSMKKYLSAFAAAAMSLSLVGCEVMPLEIFDKADGDKAVETDKETTKKPGKVSKPKEGTVDIDDVTVVDDENCSIKITEVVFDDDWGTSIKAALENKTSDKELVFSVETLSVNGVQVDGYMYANVVAGKKANEEIDLDDDVLNENGIDKYTDIEIEFRVYDNENWSDDDIYTGSAHIYPYGEKNSEKYVRDTAKDTVLIDNDEVMVAFLNAGEDEYDEYRAMFYIVNKTDEDITFSADDVSINDYMTDPGFWITVGAGKSTFESMCWYEGLSEIGLTEDEIESIEFKLEGYTDLWDGYSISEDVKIEL